MTVLYKEIIQIILKAYFNLRYEIKNLILSFVSVSNNILRYSVFEVKVLATKPIILNTDIKADIVMVTSKSDYVMAILAIKSLFIAINNSFNFGVTLMDDGTLSEKEVGTLKFHIKNINLITNKEFIEKIKRKISSKSIFYKHLNSPFVRKKLGLFYFSRHSKVLLLDSDVLFFKFPNEIADWVNGKYDVIFIQDIENSYMLSDVEAWHYFGVHLFPKVNSGLLGLSKDMFKLKQFEKLLKLYESLSVYRVEQLQTLFAIIFSANKRSENIKALPSERYLISLDPDGYKTDNLIAGHFVRIARSSYFKYYKKVLETINKAK